MFRPLSIVLITGLSAPSLGQTLFHHQYVHNEFPPQQDQFLRLAGGSTIVYGTGSYPYTGSLTKLNAEGQLIWEQRVDFNNLMGGGGCVSAVHDLGNGNLLCSVQGWYPSVGAVAVVDTNGTLIWSVDLGMPISDVIPTSDGNFVAVGRRSLIVVPMDWDMQLFKLDAAGNVLWTQRYSEPGNVTGFNTFDKVTYNVVEQTNGDLWVCFGYEDKVAVLCTSSTGWVQWSRYYATGAAHQALLFPGGHSCKLLRTSTGTWLFGKDRMTGIPEMALAILLDSLGFPMVMHSFAGGLNTYLRDAYQAPDSTFWLLASYRETMGPMEHAFIHLDPGGNLIGSARLTDGIARSVIGFGVGPDGTFDVSRVVPDTSMSSAPREIERLAPGLAAQCDQVLGTLITQTVLPPFSAATPTLASLPGFLQSTEPVLLTPRTVSTNPACGTTNAAHHTAPSSLRLFPNPAVDRISIEGFTALGAQRMAIHDATGRRMVVSPVSDNTIDIAHLHTGQYILTIHQQDGHHVHLRFLKVSEER